MLALINPCVCVDKDY